MAQRAAAALAAAGIDLGGGSGDGAAAWITPHDEGVAPGLHAFEEEDGSDPTCSRSGAAQLRGAVGACRGGAAEGVVEWESTRGRMRVAMKGVTPDWASLLRAWR